MRLALITATLASVFASAAIAQQMNPMVLDTYLSEQAAMDRVMNPGAAGVRASDWSKCLGGADVPRERSIRSCGRVIGERISRVYSAAACFHRAMHYERLGDAAHAEADFTRALQLFSEEILSHRTDAVSFYNRGVVLEHTNQFDHAIADFRQSARLDDEWDEPHYMLGQIAFETGDYTGAINEFDLAASLDRDDAYDQSSRCEARAAAGTDLETAAAACEEALRLADSDPSTLVSRGYLHFMRGDLAAVGADFTAALAKDEHFAFAAYGAGVVAIRQGRQAEGEALIARAADLTADQRAYYANAGLRP